jgi:hypothetical protein
MSELDPKQSIAALNDEFRRTGPAHVTPGIIERDDALAIILAVRAFDDFNPDNDPYGEHDCAGFEWQGVDMLWKIDYYDASYEQWEDPLSPECHRVLTVMLGTEY